VPSALLIICGSPTIARSDSAPILPSLFRVAVPLAEPKITPAAGSLYSEPMVLGSLGLLRENGVACQPPITEPPDATLTVTLPPVPAALSPVMTGTDNVSTLGGVATRGRKPVAAGPRLVALIAVLNCPVVDTLVAFTCTLPVVELAKMPCDSGPCVV